MILSLLLISLVLGFLTVMLFFEDIDVIKGTVFFLFEFIVLYILVSGLFFFLDSFSIRKTLFVGGCIQGLIVVFLYLKGKRIHLKFEYKQYIIPLAIIVCMLPIINVKFGFFGMGQDQGVYQTKVIDLMYGETTKQKDFAEYSLLENAEDKETYLEMVLSLAGLDNYSTEYPTLSEDDRMSDVSGIFHGIPTFAGLLALWGSIFGVSQMAGIQTVFWICSIFFLSLIMERFKFKKSIIFFILFLFSISPAAIWVAKSSLTEMLLTLIICAYLYFITDEDNKTSIILSSIPIVAFSFYNVTIYTIIPIFILIYFILYFFKREKSYLYACIIAVIGFISGFTMMAYTSPAYTFNNCKPLYEICPLITMDNVWQVFLGASILVVLSCIIVLKAKLFDVVRKISSKINWKVIILFLIAVLTLLGFRNVLKLLPDVTGVLEDARYQTLVAYVFATGILVIPIILVYLFKKTNEMLLSGKKLAMLVMFLYCILFHVCFFRISLPHYYYYSRYLVPFISIILLLGGIALEKIPSKIIIGLSVIIFIIYLPFNSLLATELDDTRMDWSILTDLEKQLDAEDIVIVDGNLQGTLVIPIKEMSGAQVYPVFNDLERQLETLSSSGKNVYYLTDGTLFSDEFSVVYKRQNTSSQDENTKHGKIIRYPLEFTQVDSKVILYKYLGTQLEYDFQKGYKEETMGFGVLENDFAWMSSEEVILRCYLDEEDYILNIEQAILIPFERLAIDELDLEVLFNDNVVGTIKVDNYSGYTLQIQVPSEYINSGENMITLRCEQWSPADYGAGDQRNLGISVKKIIFTPVWE